LKTALSQPRLDNLKNREARLLKLCTFGEFDDDSLRREKAAIDAERKRLDDDKLQLERRIEQRDQCQVDIEALESFCGLAAQNIKEFGFENKRLALEALQIKVCIDGDGISAEGAVPVDEAASEGHIVSNVSRFAVPTTHAFHPDVRRRLPYHPSWGPVENRRMGGLGPPYSLLSSLYSH